MQDRCAQSVLLKVVFWHINFFLAGVAQGKSDGPVVYQLFIGRMTVKHRRGFESHRPLLVNAKLAYFRAVSSIRSRAPKDKRTFRYANVRLGQGAFTIFRAVSSIG